MDYCRILSMLAVMLLASVSGAQALEVVSTAPSANAIGVSLSVDVVVGVDEEIDVGTLDDQAIQVYGSLSGRCSGTLSWDGVADLITFAPTQAFSSGEMITCVVTTSLQSLGGTPLVQAYSWSFFIATPQEELAFAPMVSFDAQGAVRYVQLADFDLDGDLDVAALSVASLDWGVALMTNDGSGEYTFAELIDLNYAAEHLVVGEFNGDGYPDIAAGCGEFVALVMSDGSGAFLPAAYMDVSGAGYELAVADVDLDGDQDLLSSRYSVDSVVVLDNDGMGGFVVSGAYGSEGTPQGLTTSDFDGDGYPDLAVSYGADYAVQIRLNDGGGAFGDPDTLLVSGEAVNVEAADFDGDGLVDLAVTSIPQKRIEVFTGDGAGGFTFVDGELLAYMVKYLTAVDIDGDGDLDLACKAWPWARLVILENDGSSNFTPSVSDQYHSGYGYNAAIGDVNADGFPDFVFTDQQAHEVNVVRNHWSLVAEPDSISFSVLAELKGVSSQWISVMSNREEVGFTVTDGATWLSCDPTAGTTPDSILVTVSSAELDVGTYTATITCQPDDGGCYAVEIPVVLKVTNYPANKEHVGHTNNQMEMAISNFGTIGTWGQNALDYFSGEPLQSLEYPVDSNLQHLFGAALWLGGIVGEDTLVSTGQDGWSVSGTEFYPDPLVPFQTPVNGDTTWYETTFTDSAVWLADPDFFGRPHIPLRVETSQRSVSWSLPGGEQFVLIGYDFYNYGTEYISGMYAGWYVDADILYGSEGVEGFQDDVTGFLRTAVVDLAESCPYEDTLNLAWAADNDGDLGEVNPVPHVMGTAIIDVPPSADHISYNWWVSNGDASRDFGPRERAFMGEWTEDFRDFGTGGTGTPEGDVNKYYQLRNREIDYNQYYTGVIGDSDPLWRQPYEQFAGDWQGLAEVVSTGVDTRYLISAGPFDLAPGETKGVVIAMVVGGDLHTVPGNLSSLPVDPATYESNLDFSDLVATVQTAAAAYDVPGYDTDDDGYRGEYVLCGQDTIWVEGDGVPDWSYQATSCCIGMRGNADYDAFDAVNISDVTFLVAYLFSNGAPPPCFEEADVNGDGSINIQDITDLIGYLFQGGPSPVPCP